MTEVVKWTGDKVFYLATVPGDPGARQLHSLLLGSGQSQCLSCNTQEMLPKLRNRPKCQFISASMSKVTLTSFQLFETLSIFKGGSYYMMDCHGPGLPYSCLHKTASNSLMEVMLQLHHLARLWSKESMCLKRCGRRTVVWRAATE